MRADIGSVAIKHLRAVRILVEKNGIVGVAGQRRSQCNRIGGIVDGADLRGISRSAHGYPVGLNSPGLHAVAVLKKTCIIDRQ